jgi:hypothetical protein
MLGLSAHVREVPLVIHDAAANAVFNLACRAIALTLHRWPQSLSDDDLTRLAHRLAAWEDERLVIRFDAERMIFADAVQRMYTDDGAGDGRITSQGIWKYPTLRSITGVDLRDADLPSNATVVGGGLWLSAIMPGRRALVERYDRLVDMADDEARRPLWERGESASEAQCQAWSASSIDRARFWPLLVLAPDCSHSIDAQIAIGSRDAALTAIALELHRRKRGSWPATLDALVPDLLPSVPLDRFDGRSLKYQLRDGHPLLYSSGVDRDDDGGRMYRSADGRERNGQAQVWYSPRQLRIMHDYAQQHGEHVNWPVDADWILWPPVDWW